MAASTTSPFFAAAAVVSGVVAWPEPLVPLLTHAIALVGLGSLLYLRMGSAAAPLYTNWKMM